MTYHDLRGKQVNKPKEVWIIDNNTQHTIEEELCRQVNTGIIKLEDIQSIITIRKFIKNTITNTREVENG